MNIINQYISKPYIGSDLDVCAISNEDPVMNNITKFLLSIGVEFKFGINLKRKGVYSWSQIYKGEIFEIKIYDKFDYDGKAIRIENDRKNEQNRKMENSIGFKELGILTKKYVQNSKMLSFNNVFDFSLWVENNNLADALGIKGEEDDEDEEIIKEDKNSRKYRAKVLALEILQLPDVQKELKNNPNISIYKMARMGKKSKKGRIIKNGKN